MGEQNTLKVEITDTQTIEEAEELAKKILYCDDRVRKVRYPVEIEKVGPSAEVQDRDE